MRFILGISLFCLLLTGCAITKTYLDRQICQMGKEGNYSLFKKHKIREEYKSISKILTKIEKDGFKVAKYEKLILKHKRTVDSFLNKNDICWDLELDKKIILKPDKTYREFFSIFLEKAVLLQKAIKIDLAKKEEKRKKQDLKNAGIQKTVRKNFKDNGFKNVDFKNNIATVMNDLIEGKRTIEQTKNIVFPTRGTGYYVLQVLEKVVLFRHKRHGNIFMLKINPNDNSFIENMKIENIDNDYMVFLGTEKYHNSLGVSRQVFLFEYAYGK